MLLRRFMLNLNEQNWLAVILDLVVVILGIFLGLQVTEWNNQRVEDNRSVEYLERILIDFDNNIELQEILIPAFQKRRKQLVETYRFLRAPDDSAYDEQAFITGISTIERDIGIDINITTLNELISAGDLKLIQSAEVRLAIGQLLEKLDRINYVVSRNRRDSSPAVFDIYKRIDRGYGNTDPMLSPRFDIEELRQDKELSALLSIVINNQHDIARMQVRLHQDIINFRNIIARELNKEVIPEHDHTLEILP
ncbi:hypothetical protein QTP81_04255 [Alteromonas sp. ASW11-36]|uniref:Uncharacterized protein n=1 Tax=Alteromonas arenosi TaxID=3055817 RepID=A0ABT7SUE3_9ALTE|nr:hypothetical protein [Alteromonas sp. ASW11-36]MDM7859811.1 hypothetical protein [Alteromonas sp. ASW11-36]